MKKLNKIENIFAHLLTYSLKNYIKLLSVYTKRIDINDEKKRFFRSNILNTMSYALSNIIKIMNYKQKILVEGNSVCVILDGVVLDCSRTGRYLKIPGTAGYSNEGEVLSRFVMERISKVNCIVDLGANFGEISLFFSKTIPDAKIYSIEASSENFALLKKNIETQLFPTDNIISVNRAVSDKDGMVKISQGLGSENSILPEYIRTKQNYPTEMVNSSTLLSLMGQLHITDVDFLKVDIEGALPLIISDIVKIEPKIVMCSFEKNTYDSHIPLIEFFETQYNAYQILYFHNRCEAIQYGDLKKALKKTLPWEATDLIFAKHEYEIESD